MTVTAARRAADLQQVAAILRQHDDILVVSHMRPDGDCLGSTLGLALGLQALGKRVAAYNAGPTPADRWGFLPGWSLLSDRLPDWTPQLTVFVDCGAVYRVHDAFQPIGRTINIDHHLTNERYADDNWIDIEACAVGEQVEMLLEELGVDLTPDIANLLLMSIMTDTGGFRYSNTTSRAFAAAGRLVAAGARPGPISQAVWESRSRGEILLTGHVFSNLHFELDGRMVWAEVRQADMERFGGRDAEPDGLSSEIRGIRGVEVSCLLVETEEGWARAGFRGKGTVNCSAIATRLGGGGHFNAAGALMRRPFEDARPLIIQTTMELAAADLAK